MKMRAAVLEEFGEPLVVQEVELTEPQEGEALVRLVYPGQTYELVASFAPTQS